MAAVDLHHEHLQRRWGQEQGLVEKRRQLLLLAAGRAAEALRERWPGLEIERCFLQISRVLNGGSPDGQDWHRRLLERMGQPTEERPAVLREASIASLQELLPFRHLVRHLYAYELQPEPVERLRTLALSLWPELRGERSRLLGVSWLSDCSICTRVWAMAAASCPARDGWWK